MKQAARPVVTLRLPKWLRSVGWRTLAGALMTGGIIHIAATLAVPMFGTAAAFAKLRQELPVNSMVVLAPSVPGKEALPFFVPDALYAICRYDLSRDSLRVTAALAHTGWVLSLHTSQGDNFYAMPAQALNHDAVVLTLVPGVDRAEFVPHQPRRIGAADASVPSPSSEGLVIVRAPLKGLAWRKQTEAVLRRATCTPVKR
jgi:uncharacterized membrane protein